MAHDENHDLKLNIAAAILLGLSTIATAWCAYQATLWGGVQTFCLADANRASRSVFKNEIRADQTRALHAMVFMQYVSAISTSNNVMAAFYLQRIGGEFKPALDAWLKTNPFESTNAPPHPFAMPEYKLHALEDAARFERAAAAKMQAAEEANVHSDDYVLVTVVLASVLFLGGVAGQFSSRRLKIMVFFIGVAMFIAGVALALSLPITLN